MKEIVILGAGYGGLKALHKLQKASEDIHITLVDKHDYHCEVISLEEVATGALPKEKIIFPIKDIIKKDKTTFLQAEVSTIDAKNKQVNFINHEAINYDYLIVALGFHSETFGIKGADVNAFQMDNVDNALAIKEHIENEMKAYTKDHNKNHLKIIVCGAGFTGVELLGSLKDMREKYAKIAGVMPQEIKLYCIDHSSVFLPMFSRNLANYGMKWLKKWNIKFYVPYSITEVAPNKVFYKDENGNQGELQANTIIWTTGVSGSEVIHNSGYSEHRGRVQVNSDMSAPDDSNVYIVGDVSAFFPNGEKHPYPTTAQISLQMGTCAAKNILHLINNENTEKFVYKNRGTVASIGVSKSFGVGLGVPVKGYIGSITKKMIDNLSLYETGGVKELLAKGKFDFYH